METYLSTPMNQYLVPKGLLRLLIRDLSLLISLLVWVHPTPLVLLYLLCIHHVYVATNPCLFSFMYPLSARLCHEAIPSRVWLALLHRCTIIITISSLDILQFSTLLRLNDLLWLCWSRCFYVFLHLLTFYKSKLGADER